MLISIERTKIIRRLTSTTRTTTSKAYSITARSNIYIGYKGNTKINQEDKEKLEELYSKNLYIKLEVRSRDKKVRGGYK
jgi:hypothetical protein